jgi:hypothetical protein
MTRHLYGLMLIAVVVLAAGGAASRASAAGVDNLLRLELFRPGYAGAQQWEQMYPVPQREPLLARG